MENSIWWFLSSLYIQKFRGIEHATFHFGHKTHIIGENGSGKTHILDALHLLSGIKNIYGNTKLESSDSIEILYTEHSLQKKYTLTSLEGKEYFSIQNTKISKPKYRTALPYRSVYVSPFDMNLLYFTPSMRRDYLDSILEQSFLQFPAVKREFERVLLQRNTLLKKIREGVSLRSELEFWDKAFAEKAALYGLYRKKLIEFIEISMPRYPDFFWAYPLRLMYETIWNTGENIEQQIRDILQQNREKDIITGYTHIWPHRDDFSFYVAHEGNEYPVQLHLSRWEIKMILLGLKIIESDCIAHYTQKNILLLVDDIFAELDEKNIEKFLNIFIQHQLIMTSQKALPDNINWTQFTCINLNNL